jgi:polyphosphate kinase
VTAVVELQARFDEESNVFYANKLQEEGAHVIFGVPGLKVHSKLFLITRKEDGKTVNFAHIGTGNFNEQTAQVYCDHSLLTSYKTLTREVGKLFEFYQDNYKTGHYKHLVVSPFNTRKKFVSLINKEIENAKQGKEAWILLKMNSLVDHEMISKLYEANNAGVKIRMNIRGICSLVPGVKGLSDNIEVIGIVDKYLEHSRIFVFCHGGKEKYYISSGDWMYRNLDHRSEVAVPVYDLLLQKELKNYLLIQFQDNVKARVINRTRDNQYKTQANGQRIHAQEDIYRWLAGKWEPEKNIPLNTVAAEVIVNV